MKNKIYLTALFLCLAFLSFAAYILIEVKAKPGIVRPIKDELSAKSEGEINYPQELPGELLKINKAHAKLDKVKITNHYYSLCTLADNSQSQVDSKFILYKSGKNVVYDAGKIKRIQDESNNILVNDSLHMILLFDKDNGLGLMMRDALKNFNPDSIMLLADKAERISADSMETAYAIYYSVMPYDRIDFYYNKQTYLLSKIVFYSEHDKEDDLKSEQLTILCTYAPMLDSEQDIFSTRKYITGKKGNYKVSQAYNEYELFNNMKQ